MFRLKYRLFSVNYFKNSLIKIKMNLLANEQVSDFLDFLF